MLQKVPKEIKKGTRNFIVEKVPKEIKKVPKEFGNS